VERLLKCVNAVGTCLKGVNRIQNVNTIAKNPNVKTAVGHTYVNMVGINFNVKNVVVLPFVNMIGKNHNVRTAEALRYVNMIDTYTIVNCVLTR
jgi:hypothetical protein